VPNEKAHLHHVSHRDLLQSAGPVPDGPGVDAVIVPTARGPAHLAEAASLAASLDCTLVTLHSGKWTSAAEAARRVGADVDLIAIDVPEPARLNLPSWETSRLLAGTVFARRTDTSPKRNLALMLSHMLGWSRVLFLDDDITKLDSGDVRRASGLLGAGNNAVGLQNDGYPDNSVVCHAYREVGGPQQQFVGVGALAVELTRCRSFFPDIYNDDWFFLLNGDMQLHPTATTGHVYQKPYDPFRTADRARAEELGDVLAEGVYWLLDQGRSVLDADESHWSMFLARRSRFIADVVQMVAGTAGLEPHEKDRMVAALTGSLGRLALITPALCERYLRAWAEDRKRWRRHVAKLPRRPRAAALATLSGRGQQRLSWHSGQLSDHRATRPDDAALT
jgi:hypothetical protein